MENYIEWKIFSDKNLLKWSIVSEYYWFFWNVIWYRQADVLDISLWILAEPFFLRNSKKKHKIYIFKK